jgi:hypothetical protein
MFPIVFIFVFSLYTPLQVSDLMGYHHVEYTQSFIDAITPTMDPFLGYTTYKYISLASYYIIHCFYIFKIKIANNVLK